MRESLERIRIWLEREAPHLASSLQAGLSLGEMRRIMGTKAAQYRIPEEIVELYSWRNGQSEYVPFFDLLRFQPFEDAVQYANAVEEYSNGMFPLMVFQELNYDAGYRFKCGRKKAKRAPAHLWIHGVERMETTSLRDLLGAVAEAFESGVFQPNDQGELDTDEDAWNAVIVRHQPDRLRRVNALLGRRFTELDQKALREAFYDLMRMNHPQTAALVREYLERDSESGPRDFETSEAVLGVGIEIQDNWSRDRALALATSGDDRMLGRALMLLAWRWRGDLSLNAMQVEALIRQIMNSPVSDFANRERAMLLERSGDRAAIPALRRLLDGPDASATDQVQRYATRDTRIAALRALGRLQDVDARQILLTSAETDPDPGTRITAVRALLALGFEDAPVEAAAKRWIREMLENFGKLGDGDEPPALKRWIGEVKRSISG